MAQKVVPDVPRPELVTKPKFSQEIERLMIENGLRDKIIQIYDSLAKVKKFSGNSHVKYSGLMKLTPPHLFFWDWTSYENIMYINERGNQYVGEHGVTSYNADMTLIEGYGFRYLPLGYGIVISYDGSMKIGKWHGWWPDAGNYIEVFTNGEIRVGNYYVKDKLDYPVKWTHNKYIHYQADGKS